MSYILSGINIKNIAEYNASNTYEKYDIIDFQITGGPSLNPSYTGGGQTGLTSWFNNDYLANFDLNTKFDVTGWKNLVSGSGNLIQTGVLVNSNPYVDFNDNFIKLVNDNTLSGTGFTSNSRTLITLVEVSGIVVSNQSQQIFQFGRSAGYGRLMVSGNLLSGASGIWLDQTSFNAVSPIYDNKNIFTIVQNNSANTLKIRQNGYEIGG